MLGVSYLAIKQWQVAALQPPHLAAICPWEGGCDLYRDWSHHGGIFSNLFPTAWWPRQVLPNQHGNGATHHLDRDTGRPTTGPALSEDLLSANRATHADDLLRHPLDDAWYRQRSPFLDNIKVPLFSAGNWGGAGLHLRGNVEGYLRAGSQQKWLDMHIGTHFESFYLPRYIEAIAEAEAEPEKIERRPEKPKDLTGQGTVLLVEDEDAVRSFAARALGQRGYNVLQATTGVEALEVFARHQGEVDLVVSDVVMPEMDGPTLLKELRKTNPDLKIIFVSGYPDDAFKKTLGENEAYAFLPKPFTLPQLAAKVKEQLVG